MSIARLPRMRICASVLSLCVIAACSDSMPESAWQDMAARGGATQAVSAEQRRAANALSLGDRQALEDAGSPYSRALVCRDAINSIIGRLQESALLSEPQLALLDQARGIYAERVRAAAPATQPLAAGSEGDPDAGSPVDAEAALASNAQLAIACLQQLQ